MQLAFVVVDVKRHAAIYRDQMPERICNLFVGEGVRLPSIGDQVDIKNFMTGDRALGVVCSVNQFAFTYDIDVIAGTP